jgi:multidrug efflux pump subunit AcrA (membrane-fusion protein)
VRAPIAGLAGRALVDPVHVHFAPTERERLDALRGADEGRVPQQRADAIPIEVVLGDGALKPGQFVRAIAVFPDRRDAVLLPERAVQQEQGGSFVLVVKTDAVVESRHVVTGALHDGEREIVSCLVVGERVITDGVQKARPGQRVVAKPIAQVPSARAPVPKDS